MSGRYHDPLELLAELDELDAALVADRLGRVAWGEVQDLRWQVQTFGFHLAALEVRQHSEVHAAALAALRRGDLDGDLPGAPGVTAAEVLATFRAIADIQARFGPDAAGRYVISFTRSADDVLNVLALAGLAGSADPPAAITGGLPPGARLSTSSRCSSRPMPSRAAPPSSTRSWPTRPTGPISSRAATARR